MPCVLSTKRFTESQKNLVLQAGWSVVEYNAIQTVALPDLDYLRGSKFENAILTSQKSLAILASLQVELQHVFCVGNKTATQVENAHFQVVEVAAYGEDLAAIISEKYAHLDFDFFCGKIRNESLPQLLKQNHIAFTEHHLYETLPQPKKFSRAFDAVLLFSPSGVESYYASNPYQGERLICIGNTTAAAARKITQQVEIASKTSVESLIVKLVNHKT